VPQIVKNYREHSRRGPGVLLMLACSIPHCYLQVYLKVYHKNHMEIQADYLGGYLILGIIGA
jgi:hypothetical protein